MAVPGMPLALVAGGAVLVYSGVENRPVADIFRAAAAGRAPSPGPFPAGTSGAAAGPAPAGPGSAAGIAIAQDALQYKGAGYVWAGAPASGIGNWDCSSFANWVTGHDLGLAIPGYPAGTYTGASHGPATLVWMVTPLCSTVGHSGGSAQAGDLCVWVTHMGIAIGGGQMISAQNAADGTQVSGIDGFISGEPLSVRRLKATIRPVPGGEVKPR